MAGEIKFTMLIDTAGAQANMAQVARSFANVGNASQVQTVVAARSVAANNAMANLGNTTRAGTASMQAFNHVFALFGGQVAPQFTAAVLTATSTLTALRSAAIAGGVSLGAIAAPAAAVIAVVAALGFGFKVLGDEYFKMTQRFHDADTFAALQEKIGPRLKILQREVAERNISPQEYDRMAAALVGASTSGELFARLRDSYKLARRDLYGTDDQTQKLRETLNLTLEGFGASAISDPFERRRQEAIVSAKKEMLALRDAAIQAKVSVQDVLAPRERLLERELSDINAEEARAKDKPQAFTTRRLVSPVTSLEAMGATFTKLGRGFGGGRDVEVEIAGDIRRLVKLTEKLVQKKDREISLGNQ